MPRMSAHLAPHLPFISTGLAAQACPEGTLGGSSLLACIAGHDAHVQSDWVSWVALPPPAERRLPTQMAVLGRLH